MAARARARTPTRILDTAEKLVQVRGFNAFSYADIAKALGIQKASLHHHFATKADLGLALVARYRHDFLRALARIETETDDPLKRLERYGDLYGCVLRKKRMCLCGMLAADVATLPKGMRESVSEFFAENERWLTRVLETGRAAGALEFDESATSMAAFIISSLEGAMLMARGSGNVDHFDAVVHRLLADVRPTERST